MNIGIVDDHKLFRDGVRMAIENSDVKVTLEAENGEDLLKKLKSIGKAQRPSVLLLDINMPIMDGFETANWLRLNHPEIKVIILTMIDSAEAVLRMIKLDVKSYLTKVCSSETLLKAIRAVNDGGDYFPERITNIIVNSLRETNSKKSDIKASDLSEREIQFLKLIATEKNYGEIAEEMRISQRTVDGYREELFAKLHVKTRVGLALKAVKIGVASIS